MAGNRSLIPSLDPLPQILPVLRIEFGERPPAEAGERVGIGSARIDADEVHDERFTVAAAGSVHEEIGEAAALVVEIGEPIGCLKGIAAEGYEIGQW